MDPTKEYNFDILANAVSRINGVMSDVHRVMHNGSVSENVKSRMIISLRDAANDLERIKTK